MIPRSMIKKSKEPMPAPKKPVMKGASTSTKKPKK